MEFIMQEHNRFGFNKQTKNFERPYTLGILRIDNFMALMQTHDSDEIEGAIRTISYYLRELVQTNAIHAFCHVEPHTFFIQFSTIECQELTTLSQELLALAISVPMEYHFGYVVVNERAIQKIFMKYSPEVVLPPLKWTNPCGQTVCVHDIGKVVLCYEQLIQEVVSHQFPSFYLNFQPKFAVGTQTYEGCEVLCRWRHPEYGVLAPNHFLPIIHKVNQEYAFDCFIFEQLCQFIAQYDRIGKIPRYSFNLSMKTIGKATIVPEFMRILNQYDVAAQRIMIEIIEDVAEESHDSTVANIQQLVNAGFQISIDDFGTGYSSYYRLSELAFNEVKIPREFLLQSQDREKQLKIISGIIGLGRSLSCQIVVEGVETAQDVAMLEALEIDFMQGYFFAKPMDEAPFLAVLATL